MANNNTITPTEAFDAYKLYQNIGSQEKTAEALGISRSALQRRINAARKFSKQGDDESIDEFVTDIITDTLNENGLYDLEAVQHAWVKGDRASIFLRLRKTDEENFINMCDAIIEDMKAHAPKYEKIIHTKGDHLLVIDPADVHIGKLVRETETGNIYNVDIAVKRLKDGVAELATKASVFGLDKIVFVIGNDILHVDSKANTTTKGTRQDTDGFHNEMFDAALKAYTSTIEALTAYADVHVVYCPSNHDEDSGYMLAKAVWAWFRNNPNVSFGEDERQISKQDRKYLIYGDNLIGFTHGDGAKISDLKDIMSFEVREAWGKTKFTYVYTHHLHHKKRSSYGENNTGEFEKDHNHLTELRAPSREINPLKNTYVETVRSPSPADRWHSKNGYGNIQAIEAFLHHPEYGQTIRFTTIF
jgi:hypothetical protein